MSTSMTQADLSTQDTTLVNTKTDIAILLVRFASAFAFLYHGGAILFGWFGGPGLQGFVGFTHMPMIMAVLVGVGQFGGGLAMLTGIFTRIGAAGIAIIMAGAVFIVHLPHGFDVTKGGFEYALTQLLIAVAILISGPGTYSLNNYLPQSLRKL